MPSRRVFSIGALRNLCESAKVSLGAMLARRRYFLAPAWLSLLL
jgi:hypothetical protein